MANSMDLQQRADKNPVDWVLSKAEASQGIEERQGTTSRGSG